MIVYFRIAKSEARLPAPIVGVVGSPSEQMEMTGTARMAPTVSGRGGRAVLVSNTGGQWRVSRGLSERRARSLRFDRRVGDRSHPALTAPRPGYAITV